jgi:NAD(P)-dependent dehydrogenase (short-subunit alcohol dehydrogenase family)
LIGRRGTATAAVAVAAGAAVTYVATRPEEARAPTPPPSTGPTAPPTELAAAAELRHRAAAACDKGLTEECLSLLDQAAAKDPAGDTTPEVQRLRKKAEIEAKPKP